MPYPLHPNTRVRRPGAGGGFDGGTWPTGRPRAQGGGQRGTLGFGGERPHKPGAAPRPYFVRWDNGAENSYRVEDLELAPKETIAPAAPINDAGDDSAEDPPSNIIPFGGRR